MVSKLSTATAGEIDKDDEENTGIILICLYASSIIFLIGTVSMEAYYKEDDDLNIEGAMDDLLRGSSDVAGVEMIDRNSVGYEMQNPMPAAKRKTANFSSGAEDLY